MQQKEDHREGQAETQEDRTKVQGRAHKGAQRGANVDQRGGHTEGENRVEQREHHRGDSQGMHIGGYL